MVNHGMINDNDYSMFSMSIKMLKYGLLVGNDASPLMMIDNAHYN